MSFDSMFVPLNMGRCDSGAVELDTHVSSGEAHIAFDHIYARSAEHHSQPAPAADTLTNGLPPPNNDSATALDDSHQQTVQHLQRENRLLKEFILLNLDMIQQQSVALTNKQRSTTLLQKQYYDLKVKLMTVEDQQLCQHCSQPLKRRGPAQRPCEGELPNGRSEPPEPVPERDYRPNRRRDSHNPAKENNPRYAHQNTHNDDGFSERSFKVNRKSRPVHTYGKTKNHPSYFLSDNEFAQRSSPSESEEPPARFPAFRRRKRPSDCDGQSRLSLQSHDLLVSPERNDSSDDPEMARIMNWNAEYSVKRRKAGDCAYDILDMVPEQRYCELQIDETPLEDAQADHNLADKKIRIEIRKSYTRDSSRRSSWSGAHALERQRAKSCSTSPFSNATKGKRIAEVDRFKEAWEEREEGRQSGNEEAVRVVTRRRRTRSLCTPPPVPKPALRPAKAKAKRRRRKSRKAAPPGPFQPMAVAHPLYTPQGEPGASWFFGPPGDPSDPAESAPPAREERGEPAVAIPKWRVNELAALSGDDGAEELDDRAFSKRHHKHEMEEKRVKKYDIRMAREQRRLDKLKKRQRDGDEPSGGDARSSYLPRPQLDALFLQLTDDLPVNAFGENVADLPVRQFDLPWRKNPKLNLGYGNKPKRKQR